MPWFPWLAWFPRLTILAVLLRLLGLWLTRLPEFAVLTWLTRHAHLAGFTRLIRVAELAFAMPVESPLAAMPFRPLATLIAVLAIMPLLTGVPISETVVLILTILLLGPSLVERGLHVAVTRMAGEHRLIRARTLVALTQVFAGAVVRAVMSTAAAVDHLTRLLDLLFTVSEDDPIVVLCVLQIVFGEDVVAGGLRIAGELQIFFGDMGRRAPHLHIRTVRLEATSEGVLSLPVAGMVIIVVVVVVDVVAATATAMLLSLPHGLPISLLGFFRSFAHAQHLRRACVVRGSARYPTALLGLSSADYPFSSLCPTFSSRSRAAKPCARGSLKLDASPAGRKKIRSEFWPMRQSGLSGPEPPLMHMRLPAYTLSTLLCNETGDVPYIMSLSRGI
jgi:hypothetical protein